MTYTCERCGDSFIRLGRIPGRFCSWACYTQRAGASRPAEARFWEKVTKDGPSPPRAPSLGPCWLWTGSADAKGYGRLFLTRGQPPAKAHRFSYTLAHGPIPDGLFVCHHCDVPPCVRPSHLFLGTVRDNSVDMATKGRSMKGERGRQVRQPRGSRHWNAKLTEDDVRRLRAERAAGVTLADLHARTGLSKGALSMLLRGKTWTHVT